MSNVQEQAQDKPKSVYFDPDLHREVKIHCAQSGYTVRDFCEAALREKMNSVNKRVAA